MRRQLLPLLALFVALGGTSYAAVRFPPNSIGTKQLKRNAVTQPKIKANAVNGAKIADDSVRGDDVLESSLGKVPAAFHADSVPTAANATQAASTSSANRVSTATHAKNAARLGGIAASNYAHHFNSGCGPGQAYEDVIGGSCTSAVIPFSASVGSNSGESFLVDSRGYNPDLDVGIVCNVPQFPTTGLIITSDNPGTLSYFYSNGSTIFTGQKAQPGGNSGFDYGFDNARIEGQFIFGGPGKEVVTLKVDAVEVAGSCQVHGTATFAS